jgi:hypothetical protein
VLQEQLNHALAQAIRMSGCAGGHVCVQRSD